MKNLITWLALASALAACGSDPKKDVQTIPSVAVAEPIRYEDAPTGAILDASTTAPPLAAQSEPLPAPVKPPPPPPAVPLAAATTPTRMLALQPPAWVEREGASTAIKAGLDIYAGDRLRTGAKGRLHITLDDGSVIKLGENAELALTELRADEGSGGTLRGAMSVLKGAFRYTAKTLGRFGRRDVAINFGGVFTAGVRGTDLWGKSGSGEALLALLEGEIEVTRADGSTMTLAKPLSYVTQAAPDAPQTASQSTLSKWAAQTEMVTNAGTISAQGTHALGLTSELDLERARAAVEKLWKQGYPAEVFEVQIKDTTWYRVAIRGFDSVSDANTFKTSIAPGLGYKTAWLLRP